MGSPQPLTLSLVLDDVFVGVLEAVEAVASFVWVSPLQVGGQDVVAKEELVPAQGAGEPHAELVHGVHVRPGAEEGVPVVAVGATILPVSLAACIVCETQRVFKKPCLFCELHFGSQRLRYIEI